jgi:hypothetical protein
LAQAFPLPFVRQPLLGLDLARMLSAILAFELGVTGGGLCEHALNDRIGATGVAEHLLEQPH